MPPILKAEGKTASERYLSKLAKRSFLDLWSYPNLFVDRRSNGGTSEGKELCDLLVVCGDHVIIFSDKSIAWPVAKDIDLAWSRWFRRAIKKSVDQVRGAERWIAQHPDRLFLDPACTQPFPIQLPPADRRRVHGVVVALGAGDACRAHFEHGSRSLQLVPAIVGDAHADRRSRHYQPLSVGDVSPGASFVHVLDDVTLDVLLQELDTTSDFADYLDKKADFVRSGRFLRADGEEDLLTYFVTHTGADGEHAFVKTDGSEWAEGEPLQVHGGAYASMRQNVQYIAKKKADEISYAWDRLVGAFTENIIGDTLVKIPGWENVADGDDPELGVRYMALENRTNRRALGQAIINALESIEQRDRFARALIPEPRARDGDTGYAFLILRYPDRFELEGGYDQYRSTRSAMLYGYTLNILRRNLHLKRVIGIGMEPPAHLTGRRGGSEDLLYMEMPIWTDREIAEADRFREVYEIFQDERTRKYQIRTDEYPTTSNEPEPLFGNPIPYDYETPPTTAEELAATRRRAKNRASFKSRLLSGVS